MELNTEIQSNTNGSVTINDKSLEEMSSFKYLGATLSKISTCNTEIRTQIATAATAMDRLKRISFHSKFKLYKSLAIFILFYGCDTWTHLVEVGKKIQEFEKAPPPILPRAQNQ